MSVGSRLDILKLQCSLVSRLCLLDGPLDWFGGASRSSLLIGLDRLDVLVVAVGGKVREHILGVPIQTAPAMRGSINQTED